MDLDSKFFLRVTYVLCEELNSRMKIIRKRRCAIDELYALHVDYMRNRACSLDMHCLWCSKNIHMNIMWADAIMFVNDVEHNLKLFIRDYLCRVNKICFDVANVIISFYDYDMGIQRYTKMKKQFPNMLKLKNINN